MKQIKKLSAKLLIALVVIILSVIVWQVIVSKRVIGDMVKISRVQSIEQIQELLKTGELKTYHSMPCRSFSKIKLNGVNAYILKGNEYAVYMSDYYKRYVEITINEDELLLHSLNGIPTYNHNSPVFIFMPEDPQLIHCQPDTSNYTNILQRIHGFKGENTLLLCEGGKERANVIVIITDMPYLHVNQKESSLNIYTFGLDSTLRINYCQVNACIKDGMFLLDDRISDSINVDIRLQESIIENLRINPQSKVGTLSLQGVLYKKRDYSEYDYHYDFDRIDKMKIAYPGQCDSLLIQLTSVPGSVRQVLLSPGLSGKYENIDCSDNVIIGREE